MRLELVRRCPGVPEGLSEALDRDGEAQCERFGETVVDLTRRIVPAGRLTRCARVLVVATAVAGCAGSPARSPERVELPAGARVESAASQDSLGVVFDDDPLVKVSREIGTVRVRQENDLSGAGAPVR